MDLFLIRHGQSEADLLNVYEGRADFPLTELGKHQAKAMARWMADHYPLDRIYTSPLSRAVQTAEFLQEAYQLQPVIEPELMEWDNGLLAGMDYALADTLYPKMKTPVHRALYQTEPMLDFRCRAERVLSRIIDDCTALKSVAVLSHGKMIGQLYRCLLHLPLECGMEFRTDDTGIHGWRLVENNRILLFANRTNHLTNE